MPMIGRDGKKMREESLEFYPDDSAIFQTTLSREEIIRLIADEYCYWRKSDEAGAIGALSNIIAKIAMSDDTETEKELEERI